MFRYDVLCTIIGDDAMNMCSIFDILFGSEGPNDSKKNSNAWNFKWYDLIDSIVK